MYFVSIITETIGTGRWSPTGTVISRTGIGTQHQMMIEKLARENREVRVYQFKPIFVDEAPGQRITHGAHDTHAPHGGCHPGTPQVLKTIGNPKNLHNSRSEE